jgi:hypothetical protein
MVWTINDEVIEQPDLLASQFEELRAAGFGGVAPYVRCSRYAWNDPPARKAFRAIDRLCRRHGMEFWLGADPRFVSRELLGDGPGLELLLFGNRARADVFPQYVDIVSGTFNVRCDLSPRHVHTLNEVAVELAPRGIAAVYAVRFAGEVADRVVDITRRARFFYNARDRYVEAFGQVGELKGDGWKVLAFFRAATNHVDFSDTEQMRRYLHMLSGLCAEGLRPDGLMWDEPGYTCTYGTLPYAPGIRRVYARKTGNEIEKNLWKLAVPAKDGSHAVVRIAYYEAIQRTLNVSNLSAARHAKKLWGKSLASGVHDTWHFESADMCDMNHGSLDLWKAAQAKSGGFVDLGGIDQLRDPASPWYTNLAAMSLICPSLAKLTPGRYAYNNLWTVGDDNRAGWQSTVMDHCVNVMALFGTGWMAHAYGPVGTIGEERSFLGSPPLPGYPGHSTWPHFPKWNRRLKEHLDAVEHRLPEGRLLVVFPVETLYALAGPAADELARDIFSLALALLDAHYLVDIQASSVCAAGRWSGEKFQLAGEQYRAAVFPYARVIAPDLVPVLRRGGDRVLCIGERPATRGRAVAADGVTLVPDSSAALRWLEGVQDLRPVDAPADCWVTLTRLARGSVVTAVPSRHGRRYRGSLGLEGASVELPESGGISRVAFINGAAPVVTTIPD